MKKLLFPFAIFALLISACGGKEEDPYEREQKEIDEYLASEQLNAYKAFKVSLRGTKLVGEDPEFDSARMQLFRFTSYALQLPHDSEHTVQNVLAMGKAAVEIEPAIEVLLKKDEDSLPTVMENISYVMSAGNTNDPSKDLFTESEEHLIFAGLWFAGAHAHPDIALYEMNRIQSEGIRDPNLQLLEEMTRAMLYYTHEWPYHAERSADDFLAMTESNKDALLASPWPTVDAQGNTATPEQGWHQLRAIGFALRAVARQKCEEQEKKDLAIDDFKEFIKEAQAGGAEGKLVDYVGLLVALEEENNEDALMYIGKLEKNPDLTQEDKDLIAEIKTYVTEKKHAEAAAALGENGVLPDFLGDLFGTHFMNVPAVKQLHSSDAGKKFIDITKIEFESVIPDRNTLDTLTKDAEGLIDKVLN